MFYRIDNALSERHFDENGYLFVDRSPILKAGIMEYLGSELLPEGRSSVDGVDIDPQKVYKVNVSLDELKRSKDTFKLVPITDGHTWLGEEGADPKNYQEGTVGENLYVEDGFLYAPLSFTGKAIVEKIKNHKKEELSTSYQNKLKKSDNPAYDFEAFDIRGNHLALVDRGRAGSDVRVLNSIKEKNEMAEEAKIVNEAILELDGERIDLNEMLMNNEAGEGVDKRKLIDEVGGMLKDKVDEELWRTIIGKLEKLSYNGSEDSKQDNKCKNEEPKEDDKEDKEEDKKEAKKADDKSEKESDESKSMNYDAVYEKVFNSLKAENEKMEAEKLKAYNSVRGVLGDFNPFGMSCKDMYVKGLNQMGVALDGKEELSELSSMFKACASMRSKVDNGFSYSSNGAEDEIEINL